MARACARRHSGPRRGDRGRLDPDTGSGGQTRGGPRPASTHSEREKAGECERLDLRDVELRVGQLFFRLGGRKAPSCSSWAAPRPPSTTTSALMARACPRLPRARALPHDARDAVPRQRIQDLARSHAKAAGITVPGDALHTAPRVCDAPPAERRRRAPRAGAPRPRESQDDRDLHPRRARGPAASRREGSSLREDLETPAVRCGHRDGHLRGRALASPGSDVPAVRAAAALLPLN
jgi:hypothetical protein